MAYKPKKVLIGFEDTQGVTPAIPTPYSVCVKSNSLVTTTDSETVECIGGFIDSGGEQIVTGSTHAGDLNTAVYWEQSGIYFQAIFGVPTTVDNGDGTFTHTFDSTKETIRSMYIENTIIGTTTVAEIFNNVIANTLATTLTGKGIPEMTLGMVAGSFDDDVTGAYTPIGDAEAILLGSTPWSMRDTYISINDASYCKVSEMSVNIDRGAVADDLLCDEKDIYIAKSLVSGNIKSVFEEALYAMTKDNQKFKLEAGFESGDNKLSFIMEEVQFTFKTQPKTVNEKVIIDADYSASRSSTSTERMKVELTNTVPAYL